MTGSTALTVDVSSRLQQRMPWFLGAVIGLSFLVLMVVFRSVLVPLKAAALNVLGVAAAYGVVVAVFQWGWGASLIGVHESVPIMPLAPMLMFAILFGLSMDYEVFLMSRVREQYLKHSEPRRAVVEGVGSTARVITSAALIMISVFASFILDVDTTTKMFGVGLAVAVFLDVTLVRMVLVPAAMSLLGHSAWWLPTWLDRRLPTIDIEGGSHDGEEPPSSTRRLPPPRSRPTTSPRWSDRHLTAPPATRPVPPGAGRFVVRRALGRRPGAADGLGSNAWRCASSSPTTTTWSGRASLRSSPRSTRSSSSTAWRTPATCSRRCASTSPTPSSPTSGCRRPTPPRASTPPSRSAPTIPRSGWWCCRSTSRRTTRWPCWPTASSGLGYLLKERVSDIEELVRALTEVSRGGSALDPKVVEGLMTRKAADASSPLRGLTDKERAVLEQMASGRTNASIATSLYMSERSVEKHISAVFLKLGLVDEGETNRRVMAVLTFVEATR